MKEKLMNIMLSIIHRPVTIVLVCISIISLVTMNVRVWRGENWKSIVNADGAGYYAYLPATFIYQDWRFGFFEEIEKEYFGREGKIYFFNYIESEDVMVDKYYCGVSVVMTPFFLLAWFLSYLFGYECDGYSFLFQCSVSIGALFYVILGMSLLARVAVKYYSKYAVAAALATVYLGSNLFYYTVFDPSCSHAFSFGSICVFIFLAEKSLRLKTPKSFFLLVICYSISVIIRPTNGLILLLIPMFAGNWQNLLSWIKSGLQPAKLIPMLVIAFSILFIQSLYYYLQCGLWWIDAYGIERFHFDRPEIINVLFSYRVGFFIWAPVCSLAIPGIYFLWKKNAMLGTFWVLFMSVSVWVISSWWSWHYEGTFGMRSLVDYLGLVMFSTAAFFAHIKRWVLRILLALPVFGAIWLLSIQTYQRMDSILPDGRISKEMYWLVFMDRRPEIRWLLADPGEIKFPEKVEYVMQKRYWLEHKGKRIFDSNDIREDSLVHKITYVGETHKELIRIAMNEVQQSHRLYVDFKCKVAYTSLLNDIEIELEAYNKGELVKLSVAKIIKLDFKCNQFNHYRLQLQTSDEEVPVDELRVVMRNEEYQPFEIRDISLTLASF